MSTSQTIHNGHHHTDDPLETRISNLIRRGRELAEALFEAHRKRAFLKKEITPAAWMIREQLDKTEEELELALSEWENRRI